MGKLTEALLIKVLPNCKQRYPLLLQEELDTAVKD